MSNELKLRDNFEHVPYETRIKICTQFGRVQTPFDYALLLNITEFIKEFVNCNL
jgi:hypothetical protein